MLQYMLNSINPSFFEGCPIVLSEVVALGIPFVGSEKAIPKEYFDVFSIVLFDNKIYQCL